MFECVSLIAGISRNLHLRDACFDNTKTLSTNTSQHLLTLVARCGDAPAASSCSTIFSCPCDAAMRSAVLPNCSYAIDRECDMKCKCNLLVYCTALHYTTIHCTAIHCTAQHCTALQYTVLYCTALQYTALHFNTLHCTSIHCTALRCTVMHCTALSHLCLLVDICPSVDEGTHYGA